MNFFTIAVVTILWVVVGFSLAFGPDAGLGLIGNLHYVGLAHIGRVWPGTHVPKLTFMAFQLMFAIITPALITGAIAGRLKFEAWLAFCGGWSLIVYPVIAHWVFSPSGWIYKLGGRDFAGGAVVHASAGIAALVLVGVLGPRAKAAASKYSAHSVPLVMLGAGILWFGWFGFNAGSALGAGPLAASAFVVTQIAAAAGLIVWSLMEHAFTGRITMVGAATGAIVGLATITPSAGYVGPLPALCIGSAGGVVCFIAMRKVARWSRFDDAFGVFSCHGVGGSLGMLLVGIFAHYTINPAGLTGVGGRRLDGLIFGDAALLGHQAVAVTAVVAFTAAATYGLAKLVQRTIGLRVTAEQETLGLNVAFDLVV